MLHSAVVLHRVWGIASAILLRKQTAYANGLLCTKDKGMKWDAENQPHFLQVFQKGSNNDSHGFLNGFDDGAVPTTYP